MDHRNRISVFIDGPILRIICKSLCVKIDYRKLRLHFARQGHLLSQKFYTLTDEDRLDRPSEKLFDWLEYNGYRVLRKRVHTVHHADGSSSRRGSITAEIITDMLLAAEQVDNIVLIGGRPEYQYTLDQLKRMRPRITLIGTVNGSGFRTNDDLRRIVDEFIDLEDMFDDICVRQDVREVNEQ